MHQFFLISHDRRHDPRPAPGLSLLGLGFEQRPASSGSATPMRCRANSPTARPCRRCGLEPAAWRTGHHTGPRPDFHLPGDRLVPRFLRDRRVDGPGVEASADGCRPDRLGHRIHRRLTAGVHPPGAPQAEHRRHGADLGGGRAGGEGLPSNPPSWRRRGEDHATDPGTDHRDSGPDARPGTAHRRAGRRQPGHRREDLSRSSRPRAIWTSRPH